MPEHTLSYLIADVARLHQKAFERSGSGARMPLTAAEARTLAHVLTQPGLRQSALAERMGVEAMTLSIYLDRLAKHGLVERVAAPQDRRAKSVVPSGGAETVAALARGITNRLRTIMTSGLPDASVGALISALEAIRQNLLVELSHAPAGDDEARTVHSEPAAEPKRRPTALPTAPGTKGQPSPARQSAPILAVVDSEATNEPTRAAARRERPPSISWTADAHGAVVQATNWEAFTGQPVANARGYGWLNMVHYDDRSSLLAQWQRSVAAGLSHDAVFRVHHVSGAHRWVRAQGSLLQAAGPSQLQWVGVLTDIEQQDIGQTAPAEPLAEIA